MSGVTIADRADRRPSVNPGCYRVVTSSVAPDLVSGAAIVDRVVASCRPVTISRIALGTPDLVPGVPTCDRAGARYGSVTIWIGSRASRITRRPFQNTNPCGAETSSVPNPSTVVTCPS